MKNEEQRKKFHNVQNKFVNFDKFANKKFKPAL